MTPDNTVIAGYDQGMCPDCGDPIPDDKANGEQCDNCGHVFCLASPNDDIEEPLDGDAEEPKHKCPICGCEAGPECPVCGYLTREALANKLATTAEENVLYFDMVVHLFTAVLNNPPPRLNIAALSIMMISRRFAEANKLLADYIRSEDERKRNGTN